MARALTSLLFGLLLTATFVASSPARALGAPMNKKAEADAKEATRLYKEGQYAEAAKLYSRLSIEHDDMLVFVRNLGACYYYLGIPEPALSNLRDYLHRKSDIPAKDSEEVERWISEMTRLKEQAVKPATPSVASPTTTGPDTTTRPVGAPPVPPTQFAPTPAGAPPLDRPPLAPRYPAYPGPGYTPQMQGYGPPMQGYGPAMPPAARGLGQPTADQTVTVQATEPPSSPSPTSGRTVVAWALAGVGMAACMVGGYFTYRTVDDNASLRKQFDLDREKQSKDHITYQWIGYGTGGAAFVTAIVLGLTGKDSADKQIALAPVLGPDSASAVFVGSF